MILLHLNSDEKEIIINPKYILYIEQTSVGSEIHYDTKCAYVEYQTINVKETPKEILELINQFYIPF